MDDRQYHSSTLTIGFGETSSTDQFSPPLNPSLPFRFSSSMWSKWLSSLILSSYSGLNFFSQSSITFLVFIISPILISGMKATCWRLLEKIQQLVPLLQEQPQRLQHLPKGPSSCISSQSDHYLSSVFRWILDHIFSDKSCTYRNQSNYKDRFRSFTWE